MIGLLLVLLHQFDSVVGLLFHLHQDILIYHPKGKNQQQLLGRQRVDFVCLWKWHGMGNKMGTVYMSTEVDICEIGD